MKMNFQSASSLADYQEDLFNRFKKDEDLTKELSQLEGNMWVKTAEHIAPSNLVIRHLCLIDLIKKESSYKSRIMRLLEVLSYSGLIWAEGYSYWLYTKPFIEEYSKVFGSIYFTMIEKINSGFQVSAYTRDKKLYPAPFGDLRDTPLEDDLQGYVEVDSCSRAIVFKMMHRYSIKSRPIGLNTHVPKSSYDIRIENGKPVDFKWYEGYDKKYKNKKDEILDSLNPKRIISIFCK